MGVSEKSETSILLCTGKLFPLLEHWADLQFIPNKKTYRDILTVSSFGWLI